MLHRGRWRWPFSLWGHGVMALLNADGTESNGNGRFKITAKEVITVIVTALLTFAAINARVSVVESRQDGTEQRLQRIESKLDMLIQRP